VLSFSRLAESEQFTRADLNGIVAGVLTDLELLIEEKNAEIQVCPLPVLEVIPGLIHQVFQNLLSNALKFTRPEQQPVIRVESECTGTLSLEAPPRPDGPFCRITIRDNGIGFEEKYAGKIFSLFQRLNAHGKYEGTGIGLSIAKKIVEKHQGIIGARSRPGEGAAFTFVLPVRQPAAVQGEA
jgi:two-component system CheB/CheR fusion protein